MASGVYICCMNLNSISQTTMFVNISARGLSLFHSYNHLQYPLARLICSLILHDHQFASPSADKHSVFHHEHGAGWGFPEYRNGGGISEKAS